MFHLTWSAGHCLTARHLQVHDLFLLPKLLANWEPMNTELEPEASRPVERQHYRDF